MKRLENKVAVITGAASGIGKATAKLFAAEGAHVFLTDRYDHEVAEVVSEIKVSGGIAEGTASDVSLSDQLIQMLEKAEDKMGHIDILVNNAGIMDDFMPVDKLKNELWDKVFSVNLNAPFYACRYVIPGMIKKGKGVIINMASLSGINGCRAGAAYTASKHALIGLTKNIAFMYAPKGIRCVAIAPGGVNTNIGKYMKPDAYGYERAISGSSNALRIGEASEIAEAALFLASDSASFINGCVLTVDGGWTAY